MTFQVNTTAAGVQTISAVGAQSVAPLGTGYVVVHVDQSTADNVIRFQIFAADGTRLTGERPLAPGASPPISNTAAAVAVSGSNFMIAWGVANDAGGNAGIRARIFDSTGTPTSPVFDVPSDTAGIHMEPTVVSDGNGGFVVGFFENGTSTAFLRRFDANGTALQLTDSVTTDAVSVRGTRPNGLFQMEIVPAATGVAVALVEFPSIAVQDVWFRQFPLLATPGPDVQVNAETSNDQSQPSIARLSNGNYAVAWHSAHPSASDISGFGIRAAVIAPDNTIATPEFTVNTSTSGNQFGPDVAAVGANYVVVWRDEVGGSGNVAIYAQLFDSSSTKIGSQITVSAGGFTSSAVDVAELAGGGFVVVWNQGDEVFARQYDASGVALTSPQAFRQSASQTVTGSAGNDIFAISPGAIGAGDSIAGGGGVDTLRLLDGGSFDLTSLALAAGSTYRVDTTQYGASQHSVTLPGSASVTYLGSSQQDRVTANVGNHLAFLGGGLFNTVTTSGTGSITAVAEGGSVSLSMGAGGGAVFGGGTTHISGTGSTGAMTIVGAGNGSAFNASSADDRIWVDGNVRVTAGDGNDLIVGTSGALFALADGGADTVFAGPGSGVVDGGSGADMVVGGAGNSRFVVGEGDTVWGGTGAEIFAPSAGSGTYVIANFDPIIDRVWLGAWGISSFADLNAAAVGGAPTQYTNGLSWTLTSPAVTLVVQAAKPFSDMTIEGGLVQIDGAAGTTMNGTGSADYLVGEAGNDTILGGGGNDTLIGGSGADQLSGGAGADVFIYRSATVSNIPNQIDVISDFDSASDQILLARWLFAPGLTISASATVNLSFGSPVAATTLADLVTGSAIPASTDMEVQARVVTSTGSLPGTFLIVADGTTATTDGDLIIQLVGVTTLPTVALDAML
ncbi:MAG: hypothetical protein EAZ99_11820 [Alphaproteobacteria bacterium]|nr:MAG: hypothetical protein EAZ99_11820 [Alphaproteobacteria bacterium]